MMRLLLLLLLLSFSSGVFAQTDILVGQKCTMHSTILDEEREYWVHLPEGYNDAVGGERYPVIYLLDGDRNFLSLVAVQNSLSNGLYQCMPQAILVGILNTDRSRDLTPTKSQLLHKGKVLHASSGGAENFHRFLTEELRTNIDSAYRTNGYNVLVGHSFGGLFAIYSLLNHPQSFNAYVAHDPSLWWDEQVLLKQAAEKWETLSAKGRTLYVAKAYSEKKEDDRMQHSQTIQQFCDQFLDQTSSNGLLAKWEYFEKEDHGTIVLPASYQAFKFLFDGICLPVKEVPYHPELVEEHYRKLSEKLQFHFVPGEKLVASLANYCASVEKLESAEHLLKMNAENFPKSAKAAVLLGDFYSKNKESRQAVVWYKKAQKLDASSAADIQSKIDSLQTK